MLNTASEAGEAGDVFSRPSYDSPSAGGDTTRSGPSAFDNWSPLISCPVGPPVGQSVGLPVNDR